MGNEIKYRMREVTPEEMRCIGGLGCPAVYEAREVTPKELLCMVAACSGIYEARKVEFDKYLIIGKKVEPKDAGLEKKVGEGEVLIEVPRKLIDERGK